MDYIFFLMQTQIHFLINLFIYKIKIVIYSLKKFNLKKKIINLKNAENNS